jgi:hypothetical protein
MPFPSASPKPETEPEVLARELVELWADTLALEPWSKRLEMLNGIHEQLIADIGDFEQYCEVSPRFVAGLIEHWKPERITCVEQAHIYANSGNEDHRKTAGDWLKANS